MAEINLTSVQVVKKLGLNVASSTLLTWTKKGFVKGVREQSGKRGGNFEYPETEVRRVREAIKTHGVDHLPECLAEGYVPPPPKPLKQPKLPVNGTHGDTPGLELLPTVFSELQAIRQELVALRTVMTEFAEKWK